ncbi:MAG: putative S-layer protein [Candidatus Pacearchaeota archaeon]
MKSKFLILATILFSLTILNFVSASLIFSQNSVYLSKSINSTEIILTNNENETVTITYPTTITIYSGTILRDEISYSISLENATLEEGNSTKIIISLQKSPSNWKNFKIGKLYSTIITFTGNYSNWTDNKNLTLYFVNDFCKYGEVGKIEIYKVTDELKDNEDEWIWHPLDNIKIKVNDVYNGFDKSKKIKVEYALYDSNGKNKLDLENIERYKILKIDSGDEKDVTFEFRIPADIEEGTYKLFVKAYIDEDEDEGCTSIINSETIYYQEVEIEKEYDRAVIIDEYELNPIQATCGENIILNLPIYNIGNKDEEKVLVNLYNKELGINLYEVIEELEKGESTYVTFNFEIPQNATEKIYNLEIITYYDYDEDNSKCNKDTDIYCYDEDSKTDLEKKFYQSITVKGNCITTTKEKNVKIMASLMNEEEIKAGDEVEIKITFTNTGNKTTSYIIMASDYEDWANLISLEPQSFNLVPSESRDAVLKFKINKDTYGEQTFKIKVLFDGITEEKSISLEIEPQQSKFTIRLPKIFEENKILLWIIIVNIILIILIIIVAIKVSRS